MHDPHRATVCLFFSGPQSSGHFDMLTNDDFEDKDFKSIVSGMCLYLDNAECYPLYTDKTKNLE